MRRKKEVWQLAALDRSISDMKLASSVIALLSSSTSALLLQPRVPAPRMLEPATDELPTQYRDRWAGEDAATAPPGRSASPVEEVEDAATACVTTSDGKEVCGEASIRGARTFFM